MRNLLFAYVNNKGRRSAARMHRRLVSKSIVYQRTPDIAMRKELGSLQNVIPSQYFSHCFRL